MITAYLLGDNELIAKLNAMPGGTRQGIVRALTRFMLQFDRRVKQKLSGEVLNVRSGVLRASVHTEVKESATEVIGTEGTNVKYARFHEYGVPHSWEIRPRSARALAFEVGGQTIFRMRVTHPGLPERSFLRSAQREMTGQFKDEMRQAVGEAIHL